jgi:PhzF family phenazine biosynthesis protein
MTLAIYQVDAFTDRPFSGNPAAICILSETRDEAWMQSLAMEMNVAETAFLTKQDDDYQLRWFTPKVEVDLCGHATLASAHILWEEGYLSINDEARFQTRSGLLTATRKDKWIELDFPAQPAEESSPPAGLLAALNVSPLCVGKNRFDYIVEVEDEKIVRDLLPDFRLLQEVNMRGVIVTARSDSRDYDFVSRFFAPAAGVDEDPVTGSAHCCLGPYWQVRLNKTEFTAYQASRRGGFVRVRNINQRVILGGQAVTLFKGVLYV